MRTYEGVIVLDTKGKEDSVDKMISDLGREIEEQGAKLQQIDKIGKHKFAYNARHLDEGYYVNFMFDAESDLLPKLQSRLKLNPLVHLQHYQRKN